jgi:UDP-glucose 4-epimerase
MRFLITGAAGFLGSSLANTLAREGHSVRGVDDCSTGDPSVLLPEVHFTRGDVNDRPKLWTLLQDVDCVYHMAARVLVPESMLYPREYNQVNVGGTVTLMEAMRDVGVRRVVFASSGAVYGDQATQPISEEAIPNPRSPYAVPNWPRSITLQQLSAACGELKLSVYEFSTPTGPVNISPRYTAPVIPYFIRQSAHNGTIVIHGDGNQTRDYVYVDDVTNAMVSAATIDGINQKTINIGSGRETSVRELAQSIVDITGGSPEIVFNPHNEVTTQRMCADISSARQLLKYEPRIALETGLRLTFENDNRLNQKAS